MQGQPNFRLHHIGFVTENLDQAADQFCDHFGYRIESPAIEDHGQAATVRFLRQQGARHWLELVCPLGQDSSLWGALKRGVSLHHQCYETADIESAMMHLRKGGCMPIGRPQPGAAFDGRPIAWMMGRCNELIELVEAGAGARSLAELDRMNSEAVHG